MFHHLLYRNDVMVASAKPCFTVVFLMLLSLGLSLGLPAEDVLDAVYDECECLPYEVTPLCSIIAPRITARSIPGLLSPLPLNPRAPSPFLSVPVREAAANPSTGARFSLALLCTLLC